MDVKSQCFVVHHWTFFHFWGSNCPVPRRNFDVDLGFKLLGIVTWLSTPVVYDKRSKTVFSWTGTFFSDLGFISHGTDEYAVMTPRGIWWRLIVSNKSARDKRFITFGICEMWGFDRSIEGYRWMQIYWSLWKMMIFSRRFWWIFWRNNVMWLFLKWCKASTVFNSGSWSPSSPKTQLCLVSFPSYDFEAEKVAPGKSSESSSAPNSHAPCHQVCLRASQVCIFWERRRRVGRRERKEERSCTFLWRKLGDVALLRCVKQQWKTLFLIGRHGSERTWGLCGTEFQRPRPK